MKRKIFKLAAACAALLSALLLAVLAFTGCAQEKKDDNGAFIKTVGDLDEVIEKIEDKGASAALISVYEADDEDGSVYLSTTISDIEEGDWVTVAINDLSIKDKIMEQSLVARHFTMETFDEILDEADDTSMLTAFYSEVDGYMYLTPDIIPSELEKLEEIIEDTGFTAEDLFEEYLNTRFVPTLSSRIEAEVLSEDNCEYTVGDDGITITQILAESGNVVIPDTIDSKPVVKVEATGRFYNAYERLYAVTVGENVRSISSFGSSYVTLHDINLGDNPMIIKASAVNESRYCTTDESGFCTLNSVLLSYSGEKIDVTLPEEIRYIADGAFKDNKAIKSVTVGKALHGISDSAFDGCESLETCDLSKTNALIGASAFAGCTSLKEIAIPDSNTVIRQNTFSGCSSISEIAIPKSVKEIENGAFNLSRIENEEIICSLEAVHIEDLKAFCEIDFAYTTSNPLSCNSKLYLNGKQITDVVIPDGLGEIKRYAFTGAAIESITVPASVETIGKRAFYNCLELKTVNGAEAVKYCGSDSFTYTTWLDNCAETDDDGLVMLGDGVLLYFGKNGGTSVVIPDSVKSICESAFTSSNTGSLVSLTIGAGVTQIEEMRFSDKLETLVIPANVTNIIYLDVPYHREAEPEYGVTYTEGTTILCTPGSAAEAFAASARIPYEYID